MFQPEPRRGQGEGWAAAREGQAWRGSSQGMREHRRAALCQADPALPAARKEPRRAAGLKKELEGERKGK